MHIVSNWRREQSREEKFQKTLGLYFPGKPIDCSKRMQELLNMLSKEKGGSAVIRTFCKELLNPHTATLQDLEPYVYSMERNPATLDQCNPNGNQRLISATAVKVGIFMGGGWKADFRSLDLLYPDLYVKVGIVGSEEPMKETETKEDQWTPTWGEEFSFTLDDPDAALLSIQVYDRNVMRSDRFAGQRTLPVSQLRPGVRCVQLCDANGKKCSSTWLLMRFVYV